MRSHFSIILLSLIIAGFSLGAAGQVDEGEELQADAQAEEATADGARVNRSAICTAVEEHEPVGESAKFPAEIDRLICWTQIADAAGQTIIHAWIHEGTTRARVELPIGSSMWRTHSSKRVLPSWTGNWQVKILTEDGAVLQTIDFTVGEEQ